MEEEARHLDLHKLKTITSDKQFIVIGGRNTNREVPLKYFRWCTIIRMLKLLGYETTKYMNKYCVHFITSYFSHKHNNCVPLWKPLWLAERTAKRFCRSRLFYLPESARVFPVCQTQSVKELLSSTALGNSSANGALLQISQLQIKVCL